MEVIYEPFLHLNLADITPLLKEHGDPTLKDEEENKPLRVYFLLFTPKVTSQKVNLCHK